MAGAKVVKKVDREKGKAKKVEKECRWAVF